MAQACHDLRRARLGRGLNLADAGARAGLSAADVDALESGVLARISDQIATVRALRRYADSLGLSGQQYAVVLIDAWPPGAAGAVDATSRGLPSYTSGAHGAPGAASPGASTSQPLGGPITAAVPTTASLRELGSWNAPANAEQGSPYEGAVGGGISTGLYADTGVTPSVSPRPPRRPVRRRGTGALWALTVLLVVLVLAGAAWLALDHWRPQWLADAGLPHTRITTLSPVAAGPAATTTTRPATVSVTQSGTNSGVAVVPGSGVTVVVEAASGPSWVQVTDATHANPIFAAIVQSGQSERFPVQSTLTIQTGSSTARISFDEGSRVIGHYSPATAPYTLAVRTAS